MSQSRDSTPPKYFVELFSDWGVESPLWACGYSVEPEDMGLSASLVRQLRNWARTFVENAKQQGGFEWREDFDAAAYEREGDRLAHLVAEELGTDFLVKHCKLTDAPVSFRGSTAHADTNLRSEFLAWIRERC